MTSNLTIDSDLETVRGRVRKYMRHIQWWGDYGNFSSDNLDTYRDAHSSSTATINYSSEHGTTKVVATFDIIPAGSGNQKLNLTKFALDCWQQWKTDFEKSIDTDQEITLVHERLLEMSNTISFVVGFLGVLFAAIFFAGLIILGNRAQNGVYYIFLLFGSMICAYLVMFIFLKIQRIRIKNIVSSKQTNTGNR